MRDGLEVFRKWIVWALLLILSISVISLTLPAYASTAGGKCGPNLTWKWKDGILRIQGTGDMYDYTEREIVGDPRVISPWKPYYCEKLIIESGVTSIGTFAFSEMEELVKASLPDSLTEIRNAAFKLTSIKKVVLPCEIKTISPRTFQKSGVRTIIFRKIWNI